MHCCETGMPPPGVPAGKGDPSKGGEGGVLSEGQGALLRWKRKRKENKGASRGPCWRVDGRQSQPEAGLATKAGSPSRPLRGTAARVSRVSPTGTSAPECPPFPRAAPPRRAPAEPPPVPARTAAHPVPAGCGARGPRRLCRDAGRGRGDVWRGRGNAGRGRGTGTRGPALHDTAPRRAPPAPAPTPDPRFRAFPEPPDFLVSASVDHPLRSASLSPLPNPRARPRQPERPARPPAPPAPPPPGPRPAQAPPLPPDLAPSAQAPPPGPLSSLGTPAGPRSSAWALPLPPEPRPFCPGPPPHPHRPQPTPQQPAPTPILPDLLPGTSPQ